MAESEKKAAGEQTDNPAAAAGKTDASSESDTQNRANASEVSLRPPEKAQSEQSSKKDSGMMLLIGLLILGAAVGIGFYLHDKRKKAKENGGDSDSE